MNQTTNTAPSKEKTCSKENVNARLLACKKTAGCCRATNNVIREEIGELKKYPQHVMSGVLYLRKASVRIKPLLGSVIRNIKWYITKNRAAVVRAELYLFLLRVRYVMLSRMRMVVDLIRTIMRLSMRLIPKRRKNSG